MAFRDRGKRDCTPNNFFVLDFHALMPLRLRYSSRSRILCYIRLPYLEDENFRSVGSLRKVKNYVRVKK